MQDKLMWRALAVIIGGSIAVYCEQEVRIFILFFLIMLLIRLTLMWSPKDFWGRMNKPEIQLLAVSVIVGFLYGADAHRIVPSPLVIPSIVLEGELLDWKTDDTSGRGIFEVDYPGKEEPEYTLGKRYSIRVYKDVQETFEPGWDAVEPGDRIRITGRLEQPQKPGTPGEFDWALYYAVRGLSGSISARGEAALLAKGVPGIPWEIRHRAQALLKTFWPEKSAVLEGILFGDSGGMNRETLDIYKASGVMHIFAASGANVAFVMALCWGLLFFLPHRIRIIITLGMIFLYASLCQANPPILRAVILAAAVLIGRLGNGKISSLRWLMYAALLLFMYRPLYLKDISFLLSFAATWGMVVLAPRLERISSLSRLPAFLRISVAMAFSVQIATLPILIAAFHRVSIAGFITNVFVLHLLGAVLQVGLLGTVLILLPIAALPFFQVAVWLLEMADYILRLFAAQPWAYHWVLNPGVLVWLSWYAVLGIRLCGKRQIGFICRVQLRKITRFVKRNVKGLDYQLPKLERFFVLPEQKKIMMVVSVVIFLFLLMIPSSENGKLEIAFLDVGQGDCIFIQTSRERILIDTGPRSEQYDAGERIIMPYLMERRVGSLDMVIITHEDLDHIGGANYLLTNIPTAAVAVPEVGDRLLNAGWQEGIPSEYLFHREKLVKLRAGDCLSYPSGLRLEVLAPISAVGGTEADANNNSFVCILTFLEWKILLTGDMEMEEMNQIQERGVEWDADFIKIPHHGSKGSLDPDWFDKTDPRAVFISVGRNRFGHPAPEVLAYWEERAVPVFRTDVHGTIGLYLDADGFEIKTGR